MEINIQYWCGTELVDEKSGSFMEMGYLPRVGECYSLQRNVYMVHQILHEPDGASVLIFMHDRGPVVPRENRRAPESNL